TNDRPVQTGRKNPAENRKNGHGGSPTASVDNPAHHKDPRNGFNAWSLPTTKPERRVFPDEDSLPAHAGFSGLPLGNFRVHRQGSTPSLRRPAATRLSRREPGTPPPRQRHRW